MKLFSKCVEFITKRFAVKFCIWGYAFFWKSNGGPISVLTRPRPFFAWQRCALSRGYMFHTGDEVVQPISWYQRFRRDLPTMDWSSTYSTSLHDQLQQCICDLYICSPEFWEHGEESYPLIYKYAPNLIIAYHRSIIVVIKHTTSLSLNQIPMSHALTRLSKYSIRIIQSTVGEVVPRINRLRWNITTMVVKCWKWLFHLWPLLF